MVQKTIYSKCPKIMYTKGSDKMSYANSADPDQISPEGAVWSGATQYVIQWSIALKAEFREKKYGIKWSKF